jgi:hypothetical protein
LDIRRVVLSVPSADVSSRTQILRDLDEITPIVQRHSGTIAAL